MVQDSNLGIGIAVLADVIGVIARQEASVHSAEKTIGATPGAMDGVVLTLPLRVCIGTEVTEHGCE